MLNHAQVTLAQVTVDPLAWIDRYGFPVALIVVAGIAIARICKFLSPLVTRIAEGHVEMMQALKTQAERTADAVETISVEHGSLLTSIHSLVSSRSN